MSTAINYTNLAAWVRDFVEDYQKSQLTLDQYCSRAEADLALMDASLQLSCLPDEQINRIGKLRVPPTCWTFFVQLADSSLLDFEQGLKVCEEAANSRHRAVAGKPLLVQLRAILEARAKPLPDAAEFRWVSKVAEKFNVLNDKGRNALKDFARYIETNGCLTPKQESWAKKMLAEMQAGKVMGKTADDQKRLAALYEWAS